MPIISKYNKDPKWFDFHVEHYRKQGISDHQIAKNLGIAKQTFYEYLKKYQDFADAYKRGKKQIVAQLENAMYKRALGYEYEEVTTEVKTDDKGQIKEKHIKKVKKHYAPDPTANIFILTNLRNDKYKRNPDLKINSDDSQTIELEFVTQKTKKQKEDDEV